MNWEGARWSWRGFQAALSEQVRLPENNAGEPEEHPPSRREAKQEWLRRRCGCKQHQRCFSQTDRLQEVASHGSQWLAWWCRKWRFWSHPWRESPNTGWLGMTLSSAPVHAQSDAWLCWDQASTTSYQEQHHHANGSRRRLALHGERDRRRLPQKCWWDQPSPDESCRRRDDPWDYNQ